MNSVTEKLITSWWRGVIEESHNKPKRFVHEIRRFICQRVIIALPTYDYRRRDIYMKNNIEDYWRKHQMPYILMAYYRWWSAANNRDICETWIEWMKYINEIMKISSNFYILSEVTGSECQHAGITLSKIFCIIDNDYRDKIKQEYHISEMTPRSNNGALSVTIMHYIALISWRRYLLPRRNSWLEK